MKYGQVRAGVLASAAAFAVNAACAQEFPARAVRIVVPFPADAQLPREMETNGKIIRKLGLKVD